MHKLNNEILLETYNNALLFNINEDFISLVEKEINKRLRNGLLNTDALYKKLGAKHVEVIQLQL
ncbi:sporulation histidine kinase inhibitor Sda [Alkalihalobacillus sp. BA299]|uniref:sporulation histidine kinase inhibitor Sda n=1 Tax=Alkalihalobacillus sp. BA299 TaxID=2815938 RepID=UPI001AD9B741|nr:sporulation histidine kinase inhibitor Sda [Alkalihalobacillus sp. BA299]